MIPITYIRIALTLMLFFLASCAIPLEYRSCPFSWQAYYRGIPLASHDEHAQAELFQPVDPANCLIYVVRSDREARHGFACVFLYLPGTETPTQERETMQQLREAKIFAREVYAMWELPPGSYILDASSDILVCESGSYTFGFYGYDTFARSVVTCTAGHTTFWAWTPKFLSRKGKLKELNEADGKALVLNRLRSVGNQYHTFGPDRPEWIYDRFCREEADGISYYGWTGGEKKLIHFYPHDRGKPPK